MALISVQIRGSAELNRLISRIQQEGRNLSAIHNLMATEGQKWVFDNFTQDGKLATNGAGWRPLSPVTIAKRRKGKGRGSVKILRDTGIMRAGVNKRADASRAVVGFGGQHGLLSYFHHAGAGVPRRPLLPTEEQIMPNLVARLTAYLRSVIKGAGGNVH